MDDGVVKTCVVCNTEKSIDDFFNKHRERKQCNNKRVLKRYYNKKNDILQKIRDKNAHFNDLDYRLKALEEKFTINHSENY